MADAHGDGHNKNKKHFLFKNKKKFWMNKILYAQIYKNILQAQIYKEICKDILQAQIYKDIFDILQAQIYK